MRGYFEEDIINHYTSIIIPVDALERSVVKGYDRIKDVNLNILVK